MGSAAGAEKAAAARIGCTVEEYRANVAAGLLWCSRDGRWEPVESFGLDRSRRHGRTASCRASKNGHAQAAYQPSTRPDPGRRFVAARDGDKLQARRRVNHLVDVGLLPRPDSLPCTDCGHEGADRRHDYDHYLGYEAEHHEHVEAVCRPCHTNREIKRRG